MDEAQKTTVYLDAGAYRRLQRLARTRGVSTASLVRDAVAEYAARHAPRPRARTLAGFRSGRTDLSERAEELLDGFGRSK